MVVGIVLIYVLVLEVVRWFRGCSNSFRSLARTRAETAPNELRGPWRGKGGGRGSREAGGVTLSLSVHSLAKSGNLGDMTRKALKGVD